MKKVEQIITIKLFKDTGAFAENKDIARTIRTKEVLPALHDGKKIVLDFSDIESTTQSFIHALISDLIRIFGKNVLDRISFKDCNDTIQRIIGIVAEYMQRNL